MLKAVFLGNSGCCITDGQTAVLLDAPNGLYSVFDAVSESEMTEIMQRKPPFDCIRAVLFSHRHSDHYNKKRLQMLLESHPDLQVFYPNGSTAPSGTLSVGGARVEYAAVPHSGVEFSDVPHVVYWIDMNGTCVYFSGDATWDKQKHQSIWKGRVPDVGIWNPNFINHEEGRALMQQCKTNILCHLPNRSEDVLGIGKKAQSSILKFGGTIPNLICVTEYPMTIDL